MKSLLVRLSLIALCASASAEPLLTHVDVFKSGTEGYHSFRIPAIVTTPDGSLVAFAEGRKENQSDPGGGDIDLVCKRSTDLGATWSALTVLDDPGEKWSASNPTPVVDRSNGRVWIAFNRWETGYGTNNSKPGTANCQTWLRYSDDNGRTWSQPIDITRSARDFDNWGAMFTGPGGAIQTRGGRLLIPGTMKPDTEYVWAAAGDFRGKISFLRAYAVYSDDHGKTWQRGALVRAISDENQFVELADGTLLMDARQSAGDRRWFIASPDGGQTWAEPRPGEVVTPVATGLERFPASGDGKGRSCILWTGPAGPGRQKLVLRVSYDEAKTFPEERLIYQGKAAYSELTVLNDSTAAVLWERDDYKFITFTRFNREFIEAGAPGK
ncbi:MAG: sialidase family protein [Bryobacteraceae bacterium]